MNILNRLWHEQVLRHGPAWVEMRPSSKRTRRIGVVVECGCGKRWLSRAPWDRALT